MKLVFQDFFNTHCFDWVVADSGILTMNSLQFTVMKKYLQTIKSKIRAIEGKKIIRRHLDAN
ncbi:hypothetical protein T4B_3273 [Trichinella pseudospiralis]|uniref:Uncharacterized protein n=1 Tax=Trichinella pseudospiralis TaxID=6337 RepID=A0A0V1HPT4_TRIPS|nr:hypothetical protein T4B_3273 [Trichinella pseudospiralis]